MNYISTFITQKFVSNLRLHIPWISSAFRASRILKHVNHKVYETRQYGPLAKYCSRAFDISTDVAKDVILYKYENPRFYKLLNIFGISQFLFWNYLCHFAFTSLKDAPVKGSDLTDHPWYKRINLGENKYRNTITVLCFIVGYGILASSWMFTLRSVRFLILRKGGKSVSLVTYAPFNKNRIMDVPLSSMSAQESRLSARVQLPIKVKNKSLYYILDMRGEFLNTKLFDYTAGLKRKF